MVVGCFFFFFTLVTGPRRSLRLDLGWCDAWCGALVLGCFFFFFFTLVTGPRRSLRLKLSDTQVYEPRIRARVGMVRSLVRCLGGGMVRAFVGGGTVRALFGGGMVLAWWDTTVGRERRLGVARTSWRKHESDLTIKVDGQREACPRKDSIEAGRLKWAGPRESFGKGADKPGLPPGCPAGATRTPAFCCRLSLQLYVYGCRILAGRRQQWTPLLRSHANPSHVTPISRNKCVCCT